MTLDEARAVLGLDRGASVGEVKSAYRQAALWCHPDKNPGNRVAEEAFKRVSEAYRLLLSPSDSQRGTPRPTAAQQPTPRAATTPAPAPAPRHTTRAAASSAAPDFPKAPAASGDGSVIFGTVVFLVLAVVFSVSFRSCFRQPRQRTTVAAAAPASTATGIDYSGAIAGAAVDVRFTRTCDLTPGEIADPFFHFCLLIDVENMADRLVSFVTFKIYLISKADGQRHVLRHAPGAIAVPFIFSEIALPPGRTITLTVRGVTDTQPGASAASVEEIWAAEARPPGAPRGAARQ